MESTQRIVVALRTRCESLFVRVQTRWPAFSRLARPLRFGLVGLSGVIVNTGVLWMLARGAHLPVALAGALATETAIIHNFLLNDRWTFRTARHYPLVQRLLRFNGVALGGMAITVGLLTALTALGHLHLLLANLLAVGAATAWNYLVNSRWTWRDRSAIVPRLPTACIPQYESPPTYSGEDVA